MQEIKMWTKKDFEIKGHFTGNQLRGYENQFLYYIYQNGMRIDRHQKTPICFTSKREANAWLGKFIKWRNELAKQKNEQNRRLNEAAQA